MQKVQFFSSFLRFLCTVSHEFSRIDGIYSGWCRALATFNADVKLDLLTGAAERQLQKIERGIDRVEAASRDILAVDKQIVAEKGKLARLEGEAALATQSNIRGLRQQKSELMLQKRELSQIVALERRRAKGSWGGVAQSAAALSPIKPIGGESGESTDLIADPKYSGTIGQSSYRVW